MSRHFILSFPVLAIAYGIGATSTFLLNVLLGRSLGASALGIFALANSVARIFFAATDFGAAPYLMKTIARERTAASSVLSLFVSLRLLLVPIAVAISAVFALASGYSDILVFAVVALGQGLIALQIVYEAVVQAHERQPAAALLAVATSLAVIATTLVWFFLGGGLLAFALMYVAALATGICGWMTWTRLRLGLRPRWRLPVDEVRGYVQASWPIGLSFLLSNAALRAPVVVLGMFTTASEIGAFAAVDMFVTAATILQSAVTNATFPTLASSYRSAPARFRRTLLLSNALLAGVGICVAVFLVLTGKLLFSTIFADKDFGKATSILSIVAWSTPILLLVHHNIYTFAASDNERLNSRFMAIWFGVTAAAQLALVPSLGLVGAAWGLLGGRVVGLLILVRAMVAARIHAGGSA